jgi:hypothetical protein
MTTSYTVKTQYGEVAGCWWLYSTELRISRVFQDLRHLLRNRIGWLTSWDSGPFRPTPDEVALGWRVYREVAITPLIADATKLPYDQYDEWWFDVQEPDAIVDTGFVNYGFSLRPGDEPSELQQRFWIAFWKSKAELYLSDSGHLTVVTRSRSALDPFLQLAMAGGSE